jgi:ethanolamine ammonia-lyase large subunit
MKVKFERPTDYSFILRVASSVEDFSYGDGTDFVLQSFSGVLAEKSYGHLEVEDREETLAVKEEIKNQIVLEANIWLVLGSH